VLADYERVGVLTRGAHSTVWKGFDPALKRDVALKQLTDHDAAVAARREARVLAGLKHPNIVAVYDVLDDDGVWLIEQWISGASLSAVLARTGKLRAIDALALVHGALSGLAYAHGRDVVHGDVAPSNILIDGAGTPMLVDFGLAVTPGQTSLGGTPGYMAPEAAAGKAVDQRSDVYSSCVVLAELLKGARLFPQSSLAATHRQSLGTPKLDGIEAPVAAVLGTGLDTAPDNRHPDAAVLLADLEDAIERTRGRGWIAGAGLGAIGSTAATIAAGTTLTGTATAATTSAATTSTSATTSKSATSTLSRGKLLAAGATLAAIIIAVIAVLLLRSTPPPLEQTAAQITAPPAGATAAPVSESAITGNLVVHYSRMVCTYIPEMPLIPDLTVPFKLQGNTLTFFGNTSTLKADGSFSFSPDGTAIYSGVFALEGGRAVVRDGSISGTQSMGGITVTCTQGYAATQQ
jgi:hypothetical protein